MRAFTTTVLPLHIGCSGSAWCVCLRVGLTRRAWYGNSVSTSLPPCDERSPGPARGGAEPSNFDIDSLHGWPELGCGAGVGLVLTRRRPRFVVTNCYTY